MERFPSDSARENLENVLKQGGELAKQLQLHLEPQSSSQETLFYLLNEILNTYDRALALLKHGGTGGGAPPGFGGAMVAVMSDSPGSPLTGSPHSSHSDQEDEARRISLEKRVPSSQLDDGHSWRKYGQKDILRSNYPRGYYRCTNGKGCLARKQVQRLDEDPTAYEVTYKGLHTCHNNPPIPVIHPQNELNKPLSHGNQINQSQQEPFLNIQTSLKIIGSSSDTQDHTPSSSNFNPENNPIFSDDHLLCEDYLLDFMNPAAPELNFFNDY
ncbi:putative WRKY transcription factor 53 [Dorcoceras hygrometricum]|uniref:Putative WRKY transcription factor 53 n=1 Tax=Dorcoceras hygrometricum TaxID=472368 RepID=A0A2Z7BLM5_9LAMI|nr:putative WRKY transcription factor 53 [Dorcoceras hygrometricum]